MQSHNTLLDTVRLCYLDHTELWNLETIGIKDPAEGKTKENLDNETIKVSLENIKVIEGNRYEVCFSWKDSHRILEDNKAEKRLFANTRRLQKMGFFEEYDGIIKGWHEEGIIEIAPNNSDAGHYLSHQAVIKDSSLTTKVRPAFDASLKKKMGIP
ncbi:uncharacterized protein LOC118198509 [Stegodyphus dumicola]|uniref:uncharacterized protein LOC118198509 n=1 Tax=Stegodyphus dumicola TaxID=202533 RepID=UPI0015A8973B|nr:uncharacterized protein LOC118198509 [Stegodyphus dumicola]